jgi:hypothetical protein
MRNDKITLEQDRLNQFNRKNELQGKMEKAKSIPDYLLASAEFNALECRKEIQKLKDILRKYPDKKTEKALLELAKGELSLYEQDIAEIKEFYGKQKILS